MDIPKYHLRLVSDTEAVVFKVSLTDQRRLKWERCASFSMKSGELTMQDDMRAPEDMQKYCNAWRARVEREKGESGLVFAALKAMGQLADLAGKLDTPIDGDLFETLIWTEANLKDVLIANKGLSLLDADDQEKYILQGQHYMNEGKFALAEAEYLKALDYKTNQANVLNFLAISQARQGKAKEAAVAINKSIAANTRNTKFVMRGAQYNLEAGHLEQAQAYIKQLAEQKGAPSELTLQLSRLAIRAGMKPLGKELAEAIVNSADNDEKALEHLVNITVSADGEAAVFKIIRQHMSSMPDTPRLKEWYIRSLIDKGDLEQAQKLAKDWVAQDDQSFQANFQLGRIYLAMQKPRSAARALAAADALSPNHAPTQKLIADACIFLGDLSGAIEASGKACSIDPENKNFISQAKRITDLILAQPDKKP